MQTKIVKLSLMCIMIATHQANYTENKKPSKTKYSKQTTQDIEESEYLARFKKIYCSNNQPSNNSELHRTDHDTRKAIEIYGHEPRIG